MKTLAAVDLSFFSDAPKIIRNQVTVSAPREAVFAQIAGDPAGWGDWFPGFTKDGRWTSPEPRGVGSTREVKAYRMKYRETILAWDAGERWAFRVDATDGGMFEAFAEDYRLADVAADKGDATLLTWTVAFRPGRLMRLAAPASPPLFKYMAGRVASGLSRVC